MTNKKIFTASFFLIFFLLLNNIFSQNLSFDQMKFLTHQWKGKRFDGDPVTSRHPSTVKKVTIEEAWGV